MLIHLDRTCSAFDYKFEITVDEYKSDPRSKANAIIVVFRQQQIIIPLANVVCIEENQ